jgi:hypothetical protein
MPPLPNCADPARPRGGVSRAAEAGRRKDDLDWIVFANADVLQPLTVKDCRDVHLWQEWCLDEITKLLFGAAKDHERADLPTLAGDLLIDSPLGQRPEFVPSHNAHCALRWRVRFLSPPRYSA